MRSILGVAMLLALAAGAEPRLVEPRHGAELAGGSLVTIAWAGEPDAGVEEWEAFLSVDGGRWFSTRITPHLDATIHRFTFEVPNVATHDARILLRFGDEKREREIDVPARFSIRFDPAAVRTRIAVAGGEGEPARPGARGVSRWVSGARDGTSLQTFVQPTSSCSAPPLIGTYSTHEQSAETEDGESGSAAPPIDEAAPIEPARPSARRLVPLRAEDVLVITRRLNL